MLCVYVICTCIPFHSTCAWASASVSVSAYACVLSMQCAQCTAHSILSLNRCKNTLIQPIMIATISQTTCFFTSFSLYSIASSNFLVGWLVGWLADQFTIRLDKKITTIYHIAFGLFFLSFYIFFSVYKILRLILLFCNRFKTDRS